MPGPLLAEAYSQARLDLDSLDKDIKKAKKVLEKAAKSFEKTLKLQLQLNTTEANRGLKEFKKQVDLVKSQIEKDAVTVKVKTDADISDARAAGAEAARAVEAGFGEPDTTVTVETIGAGGGALAEFTNVDGVVGANVFVQPEYILDDEDPFAAQASLLAQIQEQAFVDATLTEGSASTLPSRRASVMRVVVTV